MMFDTEVHSVNSTEKGLNKNLNHSNPNINNTVFNLKKDQTALLLSERLVNEFARQHMDRLKGHNHTFSAAQVQAFLKDMDLDLDMGSLQQLVDTLPAGTNATDRFGLQFQLDYINGTRSAEVVKMMHDATT